MTPLVEDPDQVDHHVDRLELQREPARVVHIGIHQVELGQHQQMAMALAIAREHLDAMTRSDQPRHQPAAHEARAAKHADRKCIHGQ